MTIKPPNVDIQRAQTMVDKIESLRRELREFNRIYPFHKAFMNEHFAGVLETGEFSKDAATNNLAKISTLYLLCPELLKILDTTINETNRVINKVKEDRLHNETIYKADELRNKSKRRASGIAGLSKKTNSGARVRKSKKS